MNKKMVKKNMLLTLALGLGLTLVTPLSSIHAESTELKIPKKSFNISTNQVTASASVRTLKLTSPYMSGTDVSFAQWLLHSSNQDGIYGPSTESLVKQFQSSHGLAADGIVGANTWTKLREAYGYRTLRPTSPYMSGDDVKAVQFVLGLTEDGIYGPNTIQAVKNAQSKYGLTADGVVGNDTWYMILYIF